MTSAAKCSWRESDGLVSDERCGERVATRTLIQERRARWGEGVEDGALRSQQRSLGSQQQQQAALSVAKRWRRRAGSP
jgi:hypothetical protein